LLFSFANSLWKEMRLASNYRTTQESPMSHQFEQQIAFQMHHESINFNWPISSSHVQSKIKIDIYRKYKIE